VTKSPSTLRRPRKLRPLRYLEQNEFNHTKLVALWDANLIIRVAFRLSHPNWIQSHTWLGLFPLLVIAFIGAAVADNNNPNAVPIAGRTIALGCLVAALAWALVCLIRTVSGVRVDNHLTQELVQLNRDWRRLSPTGREVVEPSLRALSRQLRLDSQDGCNTIEAADLALTVRRQVQRALALDVTGVLNAESSVYMSVDDHLKVLEELNPAALPGANDTSDNNDVSDNRPKELT